MLIDFGQLKRFSSRFLRRLRNAFRWKEIWNWKYESCSRCGSCYRVPTGWRDHVWLKINNGKFGGCLCLDCAVVIAQEKRVDIKLEDIERIWVFSETGIGGGFYLLGPTYKH